MEEVDEVYHFRGLVDVDAGGSEMEDIRSSKLVEECAIRQMLVLSITDGWKIKLLLCFSVFN